MANKIIYFDWVNQRRVLSNGSIDNSPLNLYYGEKPNWEIHLVTVSGTTLTAVDMTSAAAFAAAVDDDFDATTEPWVRVLDASITSTGKSTGVIVVPVDSNTATFAAGIATLERKPNVYFELRGLNSSAELVYYLRFDIVARGTLDPAGGTPPAPTGNYYTKTEADAKYTPLSGAADIAVTDSAKGLVLKDRTTSTSYRLFIDNGVLGMESV